MKRFLLFYFLLIGIASAQIVTRPMTFAGGSSFTIQSGVTARFSAGSVADFTGATITGLFDPDLLALAALSGTNTIYYRSAANTWSPVTLGTNLIFSGGTLDSTAGGGAGTVTVSGSPVAGDVAVFTTGTNLHPGDSSEVFTITDDAQVRFPMFDGPAGIFRSYLLSGAFNITGTPPNQVVNVNWTGLDKTGSDLVDIVMRNFADLQNKPTTLNGYGITTTVPATSTSTGVTGQVAFDASFLYICIATNTWVRTALATW